MTRKHIEDSVRLTLETYLADLGNEAIPQGLYDMVVKAAEKPLLDFVMQHTAGNQSRAAEWLGINRNTLRRKLLDHDILPS
jgi:Fis family transcriptional regulator, factor for inversion stimulation protein